MMRDAYLQAMGIALWRQRTPAACESLAAEVMLPEISDQENGHKFCDAVLRICQDSLVITRTSSDYIQVTETQHAQQFSIADLLQSGDHKRRLWAAIKAANGMS